MARKCHLHALRWKLLSVSPFSWRILEGDLHPDGCLAVRVCGQAIRVQPGGREQYMKTKSRDATGLRRSDCTREHEVRREIDSFLRAINSYPDRFAREPYLSFQEHLSSIVTATHPPCTDK